MPILHGVKETALYIDDMERSLRFYTQVLGLEILLRDPRLTALNVGGHHVLLLCLRGASRQDTHLEGGMIPAHDGSGPLHAGFAIDAVELAAWRERLRSHGVPIVSEFSWPRGGRSIYFHDPDGHVLELLTPGVWSTY
jgi:catechol 2,3-dioxygenase-like lactoylglutathione lyase family enzyme